jgi:glycosyltransferase involved in cell wall biosynthesis
LDGLKVLVIIPAYNEEKSIGAVIGKIKGIDGIDVVVVDDGSKDDTVKIASEKGARVIALPFNLGIGGAMQTGYLFAKNNNYDIAIQVDADGQHDPAYIEKLIEPIKDGQVDMVVGSRYVEKTSYKSSFSRSVGMIYFSWLVSILTGHKITDTTSGFRAVNKKIIRYFAASYPTDYPEVDVLVRLNRKKIKICEVAVEMQERQGGSSSITPLKSIYYMIKVSMAVLVDTLRSGGIT